MPGAVTALILCHNRPHEVAQAVESLDDGFAEVIVLDNASEPPLEAVPGTRHLRSDTNTGVSLGRNRLLEACHTDYAVFIDDDAVALGPLSDEVARRFDADPDLAVLAFAIRRPDHDVSLEYPFRGSRPPHDTAERPCAYFVGAGYAVRVAAVRSVDGYDESFFYSNEEIDLSMRLLHAGWSLRYVPDLRVEHRPSTRGRNKTTTVSGMVLANRLVYARRHLPTPVRQIHETVWMLRTLPDALRARALGTWARSLREGLRRPVAPNPLPWRRLREIHHLGGRVLF